MKGVDPFANQCCAVQANLKLKSYSPLGYEWWSYRCKVCNTGWFGMGLMVSW
jgi:hypothetical protein